MRSLCLATVCTALLGCGSINTLRGAQILEPGQREFHVAATMGTAVDPINGGTYRPNLDLMLRQSIAPDVDMGLALLGGAPAIDLRIRAGRGKRWDLSLAPTVMAAYLPVDLTPGADDSFGLRGQGQFEITAPLLAEARLGRGWSLTVAARPGIRTLFLDTSQKGSFYTDDVATVDMLLGGGFRIQKRGVRAGWGFSLDLLHRPWRGAPIGASVAFDLLAVSNRSARRARRDIRRIAKGKTP